MDINEKQDSNSKASATPEPEVLEALTKSKANIDPLLTHASTDSCPESAVVREEQSPSANVEQLHNEFKPCMFRNPHEKNVIFCLDASGSMYEVFDTVKKHLHRSLLRKAASEPAEFSFNLIQFGSEVTQWSDRLVKCTPETVAVAEEWIKKLQPASGTSVSEALLTAFSDPCCDAVYLVTDGLPDESTAHVFDQVFLTAQNRAVHCYYMQPGTNCLNPMSFNILQNLAFQTHGSFQTITIEGDGSFDRILVTDRVRTFSKPTAKSAAVAMPTTGMHFPDTEKFCSIETAVDKSNVLVAKAPPAPAFLHPPSTYAHPYYAYNPFYLHPLCSPHHYGFSEFSKFRSQRMWSHYAQTMSESADRLPFTDATNIIVGAKVLARRNDDGLYYVGHIKNQVNTSTLSSKRLLFKPE